MPKTKKKPKAVKAGSSAERLEERRPERSDSAMLCVISLQPPVARKRWTKTATAATSIRTPWTRSV